MSNYVPRSVALEGKHPNEVVDYPINLAPWLPTGDTVATLTSCTAGAGITVATSPAPAVAAGVLTFWLAGGSNGVTYYVQAVFVTTGGRTMVADFQITVTDPTP